MGLQPRSSCCFNMAGCPCRVDAISVRVCQHTRLGSVCSPVWEHGQTLTLMRGSPAAAMRASWRTSRTILGELPIITSKPLLFLSYETWMGINFVMAGYWY
jgi:hypothetical protein